MRFFCNKMRGRVCLEKIGLFDDIRKFLFVVGFISSFKVRLSLIKIKVSLIGFIKFSEN